MKGWLCGSILSKLVVTVRLRVCQAESSVAMTQKAMMSNRLLKISRSKKFPESRLNSAGSRMTLISPAPSCLVSIIKFFSLL
ncbi:hypothetical protein D9M70_300220 [compost metagenome]